MERGSKVWNRYRKAKNNKENVGMAIGGRIEGRISFTSNVR